MSRDFLCCAAKIRLHTNDRSPTLCIAAMRPLVALSAFLDVSSLNLAAPQGPPFFCPPLFARTLRPRPFRRPRRPGWTLRAPRRIVGPGRPTTVHAPERRRRRHAGRRCRPGAAMGDPAPDARRPVSRGGGFRAGVAGAHHGGYRVARRRRNRMAGRPCRPAARAPAGAHSHHHRPARHRFHCRGAAEAPALDAGPGTPRHRRVRGHGRPDDQHLHQLPDHHAGGAQRAHGLRRHRRRDLLQQRAGRAQQFRGRPLGARRRADRAHAALWLSSGRPAPRHAEAARYPHAAGPRATGARWARWSAAPPATTGRCRQCSTSIACPAPTS